MSTSDQQNKEQANKRKSLTRWKVTGSVLSKVAVHLLLGGCLDEVGEVVKDAIEGAQEAATEAADIVEDATREAATTVEDVMDSTDQTAAGPHEA